MDSEAYQLWLQICSHLEDGGKFEAAAQERNERADAQVNQGLKGLLDHSNSMLLLTPLLGRMHDLPPWPKPVWRELLEAEVSAVSPPPPAAHDSGDVAQHCQLMKPCM